jgi:hypothetical protein
VVESVGEHVEGFAAGDAVVPTLLGQCDHCPSCASEHNNLCSSVPITLAPGMRRDGTTRFRDAQGNPLHNLLAVSSFSEYTVVDVTQVVKVDPAIPPKIACLLGCGAGTGEPGWLRLVNLSLQLVYILHRFSIQIYNSIRCGSCVEVGQGGTWFVSCNLWSGIGRIGGTSVCRCRSFSVTIGMNKL